MRWLGWCKKKPFYGNNPEKSANKRCRNAKLVASGYAFRYPTFREGYTALLTE